MTDLVKEVNEGKKDIKAFTEKLKAQLETITDEKVKEAVEKVIKEVEEKKLEFLTGFMSFEKETDAEVEKNENGKYEVTIHVPILVKDLKDVVILYYNKELKCWELIEPTEVDFEKQTIKFEVEDFSLISVLVYSICKNCRIKQKNENQRREMRWFLLKWKFIRAVPCRPLRGIVFYKMQFRISEYVDSNLRQEEFLHICSG